MSREPVVVSQAVAGNRLSEVIEVQLALDEARHERGRRVHLMALLSVPVAGLARWPELFSETGRRAVLTFWAFSVFAVVLGLITEGRLSLSAGNAR